MFDDHNPRYAPSEVAVASHKGLLPVIGSIIHPAGAAPTNCPIRGDFCVLELQTAHGSRWFGVESGHINSELKMVIVGTNSRDEVRMKWPICTIA
jgi:hypothetical protein